MRNQIDQLPLAASLPNNTISVMPGNNIRNYVQTTSRYENNLDFFIKQIILGEVDYIESLIDFNLNYKQFYEDYIIPKFYDINGNIKNKIIINKTDMPIYAKVNSYGQISTSGTLKPKEASLVTNPQYNRTAGYTYLMNSASFSEPNNETARLEEIYYEDFKEYLIEYDIYFIIEKFIYHTYPTTGFKQWQNKIKLKLRNYVKKIYSRPSSFLLNTSKVPLSTLFLLPQIGISSLFVEKDYDYLYNKIDRLLYSKPRQLLTYEEWQPLANQNYNGGKKNKKRRNKNKTKKQKKSNRKTRNKRSKRKQGKN